jgi:integrase
VFLSTGLRLGEVAGLMWSDVDLAARTLTVVRTRLAGLPDTSPTKTVGSNRTLHLSDDAVRFLTELKEIQAANRARLGPVWVDTGFVVALPDGKPPEPNTITQRIRRDCQTVGVPYIGTRGLRHTFATLALSGGVSPHLVTAVLGHHDVGFTLRTYAHLLPGAPAEAMDTIGELIFGTPATENVTRGVT